jgi:O-antigen biosynthesis protein
MSCRREVSELQVKERELQAQQGELQATQAELEALQRLHAEALDTLEDQQQRHRQLQSLHLQSKDTLEHTATRLQSVLDSTSWRITEPLRRLVSSARHQRQRLRLLQQRVRNIGSMLRQRGVGRWLEQAQRKVSAPVPASISMAPAGILPIPLRSIPHTQQRAVAAKLVFAVVDVPRVSVIIPVYNHIDLTLACLQSLYDNPPQCSYEVIVIDGCLQ